MNETQHQQWFPPADVDYKNITYPEKKARIIGIYSTEMYMPNSISWIGKCFDVDHSTVARWRSESCWQDFGFVIRSDGRIRSTNNDVEPIPPEVVETKAIVIQEPKLPAKWIGYERTWFPEKRAIAKAQSAAIKNHIRLACETIADNLFIQDWKEHPWELHDYKMVELVKVFMHQGLPNLEGGTRELYYRQYLKIIYENYKRKPEDGGTMSRRDYDDIIDDFGIKKCNFPKGDNQARHVEPEEWRMMFDTLDLDNLADLQDAAILCMFYPGAIRQSDVSQISIDHYNPRRKWLRVGNIKVKGDWFSKNLGQDIYPEMATRIIERWIEARGEREDKSMFYYRKPGPKPELNWVPAFRPKEDGWTDEQEKAAHRTIGGRVIKIATRAGVEAVTSHCGRVSVNNELRLLGIEPTERATEIGWNNLQHVLTYDRYSPFRKGDTSLGMGYAFEGLEDKYFPPYHS